MSKQPKHSSIVKRLKRANGHLNKVTDMIESQEACIDVASQLQAVCNALVSAKKAYIQDHIEHCLSEAKSKQTFDAKFNEFKRISKFL